MTGRALVKEGAALLKEAGAADPEFDARALYLHAAGLSLKDYVLAADTEAPPETEERTRAFFMRRAKREPLQYITGLAPFYGRDFRVDSRVLIPRFDTETLIEVVLPRMRSGMRLLDVCTGSGCIPVTFFLEGPEEISVTGSDLSEDALAVARDNAARFHADVQFIKSDLFGRIRGRYDIITANPPYIPSAEIDSLDKEVCVYEPRSALDGSADGLLFYRRIAADAGAHLSAGGLIALEIGAGEEREVRGILMRAGFRDIEEVKDLAGHVRVILGVWI